MSISIPQADFTPQLAGYTGQGAFRFWCQKVLPIVYDDSLSYYELLNKVVVYLNNVISDVATVEDNVGELSDAFVNLQGYVNEHTQEIVGVVNQFTDFVTNYFDNLDVQEEINHKLDEMASDGSLTRVLVPIIAAETPDIVSAWLESHITPTSPAIDNSLTVSGAGADAAITGNAVHGYRHTANHTVVTSDQLTWMQGAYRTTVDSRTNAIKTIDNFFANTPFILSVDISESNQTLLVTQSENNAVNFDGTFDGVVKIVPITASNCRDFLLPDGFYYGFQVQVPEGDTIDVLDTDSFSFTAEFITDGSLNRTKNIYVHEYNANSCTWLNGAVTPVNIDSRDTSIKPLCGFYVQARAVLKVNSVASGYKFICYRATANNSGIEYTDAAHTYNVLTPVTGWNTGWITGETQIQLPGEFYYTFAIEKTDGTKISISEKNNVNFTLYAENDSSVIDLMICGYDAPDWARQKCIKAEKMGLGYCCKSADEIDTNINEFLDSYKNIRCVVRCYGVIRTTQGLHKNPRHSLIGYGCIVRMADHAGLDYISCIWPTSGGLTFEDSQLISHEGTYIKGFELDGNARNNKDENNEYIYKGIYGAAISHEIYNDETFPYARTQLITDITLQDITVKDSIRGVIMGIRWTLENAKIYHAYKDHGIYIAGGDGAVVHNVELYGSHGRGSMAISGTTWDVNRKCTGIRVENVTFNSCQSNGPLIEVRGHFSDWGNNDTLDDVVLSNITILRPNNDMTKVISIGADSDNDNDDPTDYYNYPHHITFNNLYIKGNYKSIIGTIKNACVKFNNCYFELGNRHPYRPLFMISPVGVCKKMINMDGVRIHATYDESQTGSGHKHIVFGLDNTVANHLTLNGLSISNAIIEGADDFIMLDIFEGSDVNQFIVKDFVCEKTIMNSVTPVGSNLITVQTQDYFSI